MNSNQKVVNLVQVILSIWLFSFGIVSTIVGAYGLITTNHYSNLNHTLSFPNINTIDYSSGANLLITAGVIQIFVSILGLLGSFIGLIDGCQRIGIGIMIAYAVLLLVISGLNLSSAITAYGGFDDFEGGAVELLRLLYREQIGNSISVDQPFEILNGFQSTLKCCGLWSYSDYVTNLNLTYSSSPGLLPLSCCADGITTCTSSDAFELGCMPRIQEVIFQKCGSGSVGLNCLFSALVDVDSQLFAIFLVGLVQTLVSMMFFVGTVLQLIYSVNLFRSILSENGFPHSTDQYYPNQTPVAPSPIPVNSQELI